MKTKFIVLVITYLALESFFGPFVGFGYMRPFKDAYGRKITADTTPYNYDSVKVTSAYKFDNSATAATQACVRVLYPVFTNNYDLNNMIKKVILSPLKVNYQFKNAAAAEHPALSDLDVINEPATDYKGMATCFLTKFEAQAPKEELQAYWYADIEVKVITDQAGYIAILCKKDYFTGGLHDLYENLYLNYDFNSHHTFNLVSQLKPGKLNQVKTIAERIFRKNEGLASTDNLDGYFFENGKFDLPENFTITSKGLLFLYDYYEIKPFAAGTTNLVIPFTDIKDIVLPKSVLARTLH